MKLASCVSHEGLEEAMMVSELQEQLFSITEENIDSVLDYLINSNFFENKSRVKQLADNTILAIEYRPNQMAQFAKLLQKLLFISDKTLLLKKYLFRPFISTYVKQRFRLCFMHTCLSMEILSDNEIYESIRNFYLKYPEEKYSLQLLFAWFAPVIEKFDSVLYEKLMFIDKSNEFTDFVNNLHEYRKDDWALFKTAVEFGCLPGSIASYLLSDNIDEFQAIAALPDFDINQRIPPFIFEHFKFMRHWPTLIQFAAFHGSIKCFRYLLENGADHTLQTKDNPSLSLAQFAVAGGNFTIIRLCEEKGCDFKLTGQTAAEFHRFEVFQWLFDTKNLNLEELYQNTSSIFHLSAKANNMQILLFCIENKCNINSKGHWDVTPLNMAAERGRSDAIKLFLSHKDINENMETGGGSTPLHAAASHGYHEAIKLLLADERVKVNVRNKFAVTPLHLASQYGFEKAIKALFTRAEVNVNAKNDVMMTPLQMAANNNHLEAIKILLSHPSIQVFQTDGVSFNFIMAFIFI